MVAENSDHQRSVWSPRPLLNDKVALLPVSPEHYQDLRQAEILTIGPTWRHRGSVSSPAEFEQRIWAGTLVQFLAVRRDTDEAVTWLQCYNADPGNGHAYVAVARLDRQPSLSTVALQSFILMVDYVFDNWKFRKLWMEVPEFNLHHIESGIGTIFEIEGRLSDFLWAGESYWDLIYLSIDRHRWQDSSFISSVRRRGERGRASN